MDMNFKKELSPTDKRKGACCKAASDNSHCDFVHLHTQTCYQMDMRRVHKNNRHSMLSRLHNLPMCDVCLNIHKYKNIRTKIYLGRMQTERFSRPRNGTNNNDLLSISSL